jgi:hypothetical protein
MHEICAAPWQQVAQLASIPVFVCQSTMHDVGSTQELPQDVQTHAMSASA